MTLSGCFLLAQKEHKHSCKIIVQKDFSENVYISLRNKGWVRISSKHRSTILRYFHY